MKTIFSFKVTVAIICIFRTTILVAEPFAEPFAELRREVEAARMQVLETYAELGRRGLNADSIIERLNTGDVRAMDSLLPVEDIQLLSLFSEQIEIYSRLDMRLKMKIYYRAYIEWYSGLEDDVRLRPRVRNITKEIREHFDTFLSYEQEILPPSQAYLREKAVLRFFSALAKLSRLPEFSEEERPRFSVRMAGLPRKLGYGLGYGAALIRSLFRLGIGGDIFESAGPKIEQIAGFREGPAIENWNLRYDVDRERWIWRGSSGREISARHVVLVADHHQPFPDATLVIRLAELLGRERTVVVTEGEAWIAGYLPTKYLQRKAHQWMNVHPQMLNVGSANNANQVRSSIRERIEGGRSAWILLPQGRLQMGIGGADAFRRMDERSAMLPSFLIGNDDTMIVPVSFKYNSTRMGEHPSIGLAVVGTPLSPEAAKALAKRGRKFRKSHSFDWMDIFRMNWIDRAAEEPQIGFFVEPKADIDQINEALSGALCDAVYSKI